jgi:hypothetical protein
MGAAAAEEEEEVFTFLLVVTGYWLVPGSIVVRVSRGIVFKAPRWVEVFDASRRFLSGNW